MCYRLPTRDQLRHLPQGRHQELRRRRRPHSGLARGVDRRRARRAGRPGRPVRIGQVDPAEHHRRAGHAGLGRGRGARHRHLEGRRQEAREPAKPVDRLRVPGVQPARSPDLPRQRHHPLGVRPRSRSRSTSAAARRCAGSGSPIFRTAIPPSCRAVRSSGWPSPEPCSVDAVAAPVRRADRQPRLRATGKPRSSSSSAKLNSNDGVTLVIVTHERRVSSIAKRVIAMRDGVDRRG
jgi:hypothetical protein